MMPSAAGAELLIDPRFLRPLWLLALLALPALWWWLRRSGRRRAEWQRAIDPHLLRHLLAEEGRAGRGRFAPWLWSLGYTLAVLALAGPSWRAQPQPLLQDRSPLVIAVDLSSAVEARDLPPNRLARARAEIQRILDRRAGQVALVAYADDAYTVAPLTDDAANIALFLPALGPQVMPLDTEDGAPGRADRAIDEALRLLRRAGFRNGEVLLMTAGADEDAEAAAERAADVGVRVSVLGLGTLRGGMFRDREGAEYPARLDPAPLRALAGAGGGTFAAYSDDDRDLEALGAFDSVRIAPTVSGRQSAAEPLDDGYWLLPPLLALALLAFRRGVLVLALAVCLLPLHSPPAAAADLWRRDDQRQHARLQEGLERYEAREYEAALGDWQDLPGADAAYNRGNALARLGKYPEAVAEYDRALQLRPEMLDAAENRRIVLDAMRKPPPPPKPKDSEKKPPEEGKGQSGKDDKNKDGKQDQNKDQNKDQDQGRNDSQQKGGGSQGGQRQDSDGRQGGARQDGSDGNRSERSPSPPPRDGTRDTASGQPQPRPQAQRGEAAQAAQRPQQRGAGQAPQPARDGPDPGRDAKRDADEQRRADAAQRARMQRALAERGTGTDAGQATAGAGREGSDRPETPAERQRRLSIEARLRRVEDKPGDLLRTKFELEHARRKREGERR